MDHSEAPLAGRTLIMSGGSRGIGESIALKAAAAGANVALVAKTAEPHPRLPGTVYTAAEKIREAGGRALPIIGDIRDDASVADAVAATVAEFGGIDVVVNNASALDTSRTEDLSMKKYDLMQSINARGSFLLAKAAIPWLKKSPNPHILTLSPPIVFDPKYFATIGTGYTISKFSMSMVTIGLAAELADDGVAANSLWPRTMVATAAVQNIIGGELIARSRTPEIMGDAALAIIVKPAREYTGRLVIDDDVLAAEGVTDFTGYQVDPSLPETELELDFWVDGFRSGTPERAASE
ncbi:MAG: SDR family oxidoreductase [Gordonia sp. (in: high G+C Gram-positive bacteria)]|uniref:SDR family oxidoreductase n=1 Tax=Gordonia sp. (in: high G+C Gram-positive bacteria) TaxID=84139 RepID=UPI0039E28E5C